MELCETRKSKLSSSLLNFVLENFLQQHVTDFTRYSSSNSIIDLVLSTDASLVSNVQINPGISDHERINFNINVSKPKSKCVKKRVSIYTTETIKNLRNAIGEADWNSTIDYNSVDNSWNLWKGLLLKLIDENIPTRTVQSKSVSVKWFTSDLRKLIRKQNRLHKQRKRSTSANLKFLKFRKYVKIKLREAEQIYINGLCESLPSKPRKFWNFVKSKRCDYNGISVLKVDNDIYTCDKDKAKVLNDQFSSVFKSDSYSAADVNINDKYNLNKSVNNILTDISIGANSVYKSLKRLDCSKAVGPDGIPTKVLKEAASELALPLSDLFNLTLQTGEIPQEWKLADIVPIFKKGSKDDARNYRPVSLTPIICKILERLVCDQLVKFLNYNNILVDNQHGFRAKRSCETQLLQCVNDWSLALDNKNNIDIIFLDISRAFDTVSHVKLMKKLDNIGIKGNMLNWFKSFLTGRKQRVKINKEFSEWSNVTSGVPQGTIIGPVAFLIYINDITNNIKCQCMLYADDCVLYSCVNNANDAKMLQHDLDRVIKWSRRWSMDFNVNKCKVMHMTKKNNISFNSYYMNGSKLGVTETEKYLGVQINHKFSWKCHVDVVKKDCYRKLGIIKRVFSKCNNDIKSKLYKQLIRPKLDYCVNVWKPTTPGLQRVIERIQKRAAGIVLGRRVEDYIRDLSVLAWSPVHMRQNCQELCLMYKIINNEIDIDFDLFFKYKELSKNLRCKNSLQLKPKFARTEMCKLSFFHRIIPLWNKLPEHIVKAENLKHFKTNLELLYFKCKVNCAICTSNY